MKRLTLALTAALTLVLAGCGGTKTRTVTVTRTVAATPQLPTAQHPNPVHNSPGFGKLLKGARLPAPARGVSTLTMYDNVTLSAIPSFAAAVACYASGSYVNCGEAAQRFPHAYRVSIATYAGAAAQCLDVEPGDAVPSQTPFWFRLATTAGFHKPCIYASISTMPQVRYYLTAAGIARSRYLLWDAYWTFHAHIDAGYDATQYYGGNVQDISLATLEFVRWGNPPPPPPGPSPAQLTDWRGARNSSFTAYHNRRCANGLDRRAHCDVFAGRVVYFQQRLWSKYPKWHCWGPGARTKTQVCWILRPEVNRWSGARDATGLALQRNACEGPISFPNPRHTPLCDKLRQRRSWFQHRIDGVFY